MLWSAANKMQQPDDIPQVHIVALWVALAALVIKSFFSLYAGSSNPSKIHYAGCQCGMPALMPPHLWWWLLVLLVVYQV
jgi:hypothetical protein